MIEVPVRKGGMETMTSMFLLILSAMLIFGVLDFMVPDEASVSSLIRLRTYQAASMGGALMGYSPTGSVRPVCSLAGAVDVAAYYWTGSTFNRTEGPFTDHEGWICDLLSTTPDGLSSVLIIHRTDNVRTSVAGEFVTWTGELPGGSSVSIHLSIKPGSMNLGDR